MKRLHCVWPEIVSFGNLYRAYLAARKGKRTRVAVARFSLDLERELLTLQRQLESGTWRPGRYRQFTIYERKPRLISAAPFRDRVVHHALMRVIEPPLDRGFIHDSWACRKGKGVHRAVARYQGWSRRYTYALKMDVRRYFPSIDHRILKEKLRRRIADPRAMDLLERIIDGGPDYPAEEPSVFPGDDLLTPLERRRGIPIGNLTSQFFANLYLDDLDHFVKETLRVKAYLRYVDDMVLLGDDKARLWDILGAVHERLGQDRLRLHPGKSQVTRTHDGLDLLGYRVFPASIRLRDDNGHRFARRLRGFARGWEKGELKREDFDPSVQSWIGHASRADTRGLRREIFGNTIFTRGSGREAASA